MNRGYDFSAGPAQLPERVLHEAQAELLNWEGQGCSMLELGHRTPAFEALLMQAQDDLRALLSIPDNYHVLFLGGAARMQFSMVPMNLIHPSQTAAYLLSGTWSQLAYEEAARLSSAYVLGSSGDGGYRAAPDFSSQAIQPNTAYVYYTPNETVHGVRFDRVPKGFEMPLVADMTSCLLSEPINIDDYGLIFAGAQKNIAAAGLTLVIVRADLLTHAPSTVLPYMLDYRTHVTHRSLYATPPTFQCYLAAKVFQWIKEQGGVSALSERNEEKAAALYDFIDASSFYRCDVEKRSRSRMNVCFSLTNAAYEDAFLRDATQAGLYNLKGHRLVGGLRASLYNAMPMEGVLALIAFMKTFAKENQTS